METSGAQGAAVSMQDDVRRDYEDLKNHFGQTRFEDFSSGEWFASFVKWMLEEYARTVDAEYIRTRYPGAGPHNQAQKAINIAVKYAGVAGGVSAATVTGLQAATVGSGGPGAIVTVPAIGTALMVDVGFTTRVQLRTTYDLSVIYRCPLSLNDAEDCYWVFLTALGIKTYELAGDVIKVVGPKVLQYNARKLLRAGVRRFLIEVVKRVAGSQIARKLTEKALLRVVVPGIGIPVSAWMNSHFTRKLLEKAQEQMRERGSVITPLIRLFQATRDFPREMVIKALVVTMEAPKRAGWEENQLNALRYAQKFLALSDEEVGKLDDWFDRSVKDFVTTLPPLPPAAAVALIDFLVQVAALGTAEHDAAYARAIFTIAKAVGCEFEESNIAAARKVA